MRKTFPWYDSIWLSNYVTAKKFIKENYPAKLNEFVEAFAPLRTRKDFKVIKLTDFLSQEILEKSKEIIRNLEEEKKETHEVMSFGRFIAHNLDFLTEVQNSITDKISELVKEEVKPLYNVLCLYKNLGVCKVHMDAPEAKYTVDLCVEQSTNWKIYISQTKEWAEDFEVTQENWIKQIISDPTNHFKGYALKPGSGIIFSGSSQWHYRNRIFEFGKEHFCHLIFFHFIPKGMDEIIHCKNWAELFDIQELDSLVVKYS